MIGIFHIHTSYSSDAAVSPKKVVARLQELGVDFAAITDHQTIQGALEVKRLAPPTLTIIVGAEYHTEKGDIIGLFMEKEVKSSKSNELISEIKAQGGIVVLPHPYKAHKLDAQLIQSVDAIEVYNSRTDRLKNYKALALAKEYNKKKMAGSDAHFTQEIGLTMMEFSNKDLKFAILNGEGEIIKAQESLVFYPPISGMINLYKTKNLYLLLKWIGKLVNRR